MCDILKTTAPAASWEAISVQTILTQTACNHPHTNWQRFANNCCSRQMTDTLASIWVDAFHFKRVCLILAILLYKTKVAEYLYYTLQLNCHPAETGWQITEIQNCFNSMSFFLDSECKHSMRISVLISVYVAIRDLRFSPTYQLTHYQKQIVWNFQVDPIQFSNC